MARCIVPVLGLQAQRFNHGMPGHGHVLCAWLAEHVAEVVQLALSEPQTMK